MGDVTPQLSAFERALSEFVQKKQFYGSAQSHALSVDEVLRLAVMMQQPPSILQALLVSGANPYYTPRKDLPTTYALAEAFGDEQVLALLHSNRMPSKKSKPFST